MNALILTGRALPGFIDQHVWQQAAAIFSLDAESFANRVLARCPIAVRETPDNDEAQKLRLRLNQCGAEVEMVQTDGVKWQIERDGIVLGPVPLSFLALEHATRRLPRDTNVKRAADSTWITLESAVAGDTATRVSLKRPRELTDVQNNSPPVPPAVFTAPAPGTIPTAHTPEFHQDVNALPVATATDYGLFLLAIPAAAIALIWIWVSQMTLLQSPKSTLNLITIVTVIATAGLAAMEAARARVAADRSKGIYSPVAWFFLIVILWLIGYPYYLAKRRYYGLKNWMWIGIFIALAFIASVSIMDSAIDATKHHLLNQLQSFDSD